MDKALIVFLDRDGVICEFAKSWSEFRFLPGVREALRLLNEAGAIVVVVSNQAGVNRGLYTSANLAEIDRRMREAVAASGGRVHAAYYCPHTEEERCTCRKPAPGLFERAVRDLGLNLADSRACMVGDSECDIIAGRRLGLTAILVLSGATVTADQAGQWAVRPDHVAADLAGALDYII